VSGPQLPDSVTPEQLDRDARSQLNSLPNDLADTVARYLVAADLADDREQGYAYSQAAKRLAARVGVVREACGIAAYRTGRWAEALSELRAARRLTGRDDYLPIMADCERALGRLDRALALVREATTADLDRATRIELRIVESGIRRDQGLSDAAVLALQVPELTSGRLRPWSARLFYAYADALLAAGRADEARDAFARAAQADPDGETDAADRLDELDGIEFDDLEDDDLEDDDLEDDDLEDDDLDLDASDLEEVDVEAGHPEEGGLDDDDVEGDDFDERHLDDEHADDEHADDEHADEEDPTASHPG
jgi:tetratricopeptide (TPR) repeat protein